jgi:hypothetical protein
VDQMFSSTLMAETAYGIVPSFWIQCIGQKKNISLDGACISYC